MWSGVGFMTGVYFIMAQATNTKRACLRHCRKTGTHLSIMCALRASQFTISKMSQVFCALCKWKSSWAIIKENFTYPCFSYNAVQWLGPSRWRCIEVRLYLTELEIICVQGIGRSHHRDQRHQLDQRHHLSLPSPTCLRHLKWQVFFSSA